MSSATGISFATFRQVAPFVVKINKPIMLRGKHGVGKSELVYQIAKDLNLPVVERRVSQMTEGDLIGLPSIEERNGHKVSTFNMPDWFHEASEKPCILFLDELGRGTIEVRQGIFELADSRKIFGKKLHPETLIFAADNGGIHGAQYQVADMDPAELSRWTVFDVEPSVEDWLEWGKSLDENGVPNICTEIREYITINPKSLHHDGEYEPGKVYPDNRAWKRFNDSTRNTDLLTKGSSILTYLAMGFIGMETAIHFNDFIQNYDRRLTVEDLLIKGKLELVKDYDVTKHCAMIEQFKDSKVFEKELSKQALKNLADYICLLPSEAAFMLWQSLGNMGGKNRKIIPNLHATISSSGVKIEEKMAEIFKQRQEADNISKEKSKNLKI